jgi:hypothetical protein
MTFCVLFSDEISPHPPHPSAFAYAANRGFDGVNPSPVFLAFATGKNWTVDHKPTIGCFVQQPFVCSDPSQVATAVRQRSTPSVFGWRHIGTSRRGTDGTASPSASWRWWRTKNAE